jgi:ubiquitin-protein ligase
MDQNDIIITKETFRRLLRDIKDVVVNPLHSHGIYYIHNDDDILSGKALIIGPTETPYEHGFYLFEYKFPPSYPHAPPEVKFCTSDGKTRFNPNLYIQGKVCVSILNTWQGEQWTGCQTIASSLLALCSLLNNMPLLNEPGVTEKSVDVLKYNKIITYRNYETAMLHVLMNEYTHTNFDMFMPTMKTHFLEHFDHNVRQLEALCELYPTKECIQTSIYHLTCVLDYKTLLERFHVVKQELLAE